MDTATRAGYSQDRKPLVNCSWFALKNRKEYQVSRIIKFALLFVLVTTFYVASSQGIVSAASLHANHRAIALNDGCYNNNGKPQNGMSLCNGDDPQSSGCAADAKTVTSAPIMDAQFNTIGLIELRFSPHCKTNWGRVTSYIGAIELVVSIGYGTCDTNDIPLYENQLFGYSQAWGDMVFAPTAIAKTIGQIGSQHYMRCIDG